MVLGEKLFEENGNIIGVKVVKVHPIEGITTDVSFTSEIKGEGRYPSGENLGIMTGFTNSQKFRD
jgi:hypothetical protein